jgi:hypothetical protein
MKRNKKEGILALCLLVMMGLVALINREENQKKQKQKGSPFTGDDRKRSSPTQLHPKAPKKKQNKTKQKKGS